MNNKQSALPANRRARLPGEHDRIFEAYLEMWQKARYRPQAPSDGYGHLLLSKRQLKDSRLLDEEAEKYAARFVSEEDTCIFWIGVSTFATTRALVYAVEACRLLCDIDRDSHPVALKLLTMAAAEVNQGLDETSGDPQASTKAVWKRIAGQLREGK